MQSHNSPSLILFRADLRIEDNLALAHAVSQERPVIALYVMDDISDRPLGGASRWWLHHSLMSLRQSLLSLNIPLVLRQGSRLDVVKDVVQSCGASAVFWNRHYDKAGIELGRQLKQWAQEKDLEAASFEGSLLHEPMQMKTKTGGFFKVFTPFWKSYLSNQEPRSPIDAPQTAPPYGSALFSDILEDWKLLPTQPNWATGFEAEWQPGETGARKALEAFLAQELYRYSTGRDVPAIKATSMLSAHIRFGEISPVQIWHEAKKASQAAGAGETDKFLSEIGWREFAHHLLFHNQDLQTQNFNVKFDHFPWNDTPASADLFKAWTKGLTGYPIVDAGMRQLWQTGWMHNRVRMIVGSFLVKHLLIDWRQGEEWFWDTLVDACPANNTASWQWIAGCGADAAPYFRVFNPILQGEKFDTAGDYVRRYVPELSKLPNKLIHKPWVARAEELALCNVILGKTYPTPIVDHAFARDRALKAFGEIKTQAA